MLSTYNRSDQVVRVTIPEGSTVVEIARILEDNRVCTVQDFYNAVNRTDYQYFFLTEEVLNNTSRYFLLEGYLFPDTYDFYVNEHASDVVETMLDNFADHYTSEVRQAVESSGMSLHRLWCWPRWWKRRLPATPSRWPMCPACTTTGCPIPAAIPTCKATPPSSMRRT